MRKQNYTMKKLYLFIVAAAFSQTVILAQSQLLLKGSNETIVPANLSELHPAGRPPLPTVQFFNDVIIENNTSMDQRHVRISVAFNGWLYAAYNTVDTINGNGGITIRTSRDNGNTWNTIDSYSVSGIRYPAFDIVVAGTDTNNMVLFLAGVNENTVSGAYTLYVDKYNAATGAFVGSNYNMQNATSPIYDVALASDYRFPASGASPYSVGLLYSTYGNPSDSIVFLGSSNGGVIWDIRQSVSTTGNFFRKVSIAYGRSASASNGRYFGAWEMIGSASARTGHIYTSRSGSLITSPWIAPVNLDSVSGSMINLCSNPQMAVQYNNIDNDSSSCTAVVLVQRDFNGDGADHDILGFYNKRSHFTNFWTRLDVINASENDVQPDITYDPGADNFVATYYDSTNAHLPCISNPMNLLTPSGWSNISTQYNDQTNLAAAYPRIDINPFNNQPALAWIAELPGISGIAMFDAQYVINGISANTHGGFSTSLYPNPANDAVTIAFGLDKQTHVSYQVYDIAGKLIATRDLGTLNSGNHNEQLEVSTWNNGVYFVRINNGENVITTSMVIAH